MVEQLSLQLDVSCLKPSVYGCPRQPCSPGGACFWGLPACPSVEWPLGCRAVGQKLWVRSVGPEVASVLCLVGSGGRPGYGIMEAGVGRGGQG